tara:strand:- start:31034 stop:31702 length:669 start_codon:yes stop_codon:yes gene_type:complete
VSKHLLFDLDGTLMDTAADFTKVLNRQLEKHGREQVSYEQVRQTVSDGARALVRLGYGIDESDPAFNAYLQELLDAYSEQIGQTEASLFSGIEHMLQDIAASQFQWGIVTNKPSRFTTPLLENFPLLSASAVVVCADHLSRSKPDPEGLMLACQTLGCEADQCIYIGDHLRDVEAGKNAGMMTVAVSWGYFPPGTRLEDWQADLIVSSPQEISDYVFGKRHV